MAYQPTNSSLADRYAQMSRISEMLDSLIGLDTPTPSATFTTGPNRGLPVSAMPPSVTPFRQKSGPRRVSKVTAETARARADRAARPAKMAERFARNAPKPPALLAREEPAPTKAKPAATGPRPAPYDTRTSNATGPLRTSRDEKDFLARSYDILKDWQIRSGLWDPNSPRRIQQQLSDEAERSNYQAGKFKWGMTPEEIEAREAVRGPSRIAYEHAEDLSPVDTASSHYLEATRGYNRRMDDIRERALSNIAKIGNERESQFAQQQRAADEAAFQERTRELLSPERAQRLEDSIAADRKQGQIELEARLRKNKLDSVIAGSLNEGLAHELRIPFYVSDEDRARAIKELGLKPGYAGRMTTKFDRGEAEYPSGIYLDPGFPSLSEAYGRFMNLPDMANISYYLPPNY